MSAPAFSDPARGVAYPGRAIGRHARRALTAPRVHALPRRATIAGLFAAMAAGSVALWTAVPAGVLWLISRVSSSSGAPSVGVAVLVAVGIPGAIVLAARLLLRVERVYMEMTGMRPSSPVVPGWRHSLSDSSAPRGTGVLEKMAVASVLLALVALAAWFFAFAGSSLPA